MLFSVSKMDHKQSDCLMVVILSHGDLGKLYCRDGSYELEMVKLYFTSHRCPSLKGKPRIFLVQACRGSLFDDGFKFTKQTKKIRRHSDGHYENIDTSVNEKKRIELEVVEMVHNPLPHMDFLIVRSTMPNYVSFRGSTTGSWFIQDFCAELDMHGTKSDILTVLTKTNGKVTQRESATSNHLTTGKKQTLCISSMLTKILIFNQVP